MSYEYVYESEEAEAEADTSKMQVLAVIRIWFGTFCISFFYLTPITYSVAHQYRYLPAVLSIDPSSP